MKSALIIPTLDEIEGMKQVVSKIKKEWVDEIIIVDGDSTDGTIEEAKRQNLKVLMQKTKGVSGHGALGAAILDGFNSSDADYLLMFGADGNNDPLEIPRMLEKIKEGYDQVINTRFGKTSGPKSTGFIDYFGNKMFTSFANILFGGNLTDTLSSSRAITRKAWKEIKLDELGPSSVYQISVLGLVKKHKFFEIDANEGHRIGGERKMQRIYTGKTCISILMKALFSKK